MSEIVQAERFELMDRVVREYILRGVNNPTTIAKELGMKRKDVVVILEEWKGIAQNNEGLKARAAEVLTEMDRAYDDVIKELWKAHAEGEDSKAKTATLKTIADVIAKRQDVLQKAGLYDDAAIGDQLAVMEEQAEAIKELMKAVAAKFPETKNFIMMELHRIFGGVVPEVSPDGGETPVA